MAPLSHFARPLIVAALCLTAAACGSDDEATEAVAGETAAPAFVLPRDVRDEDVGVADRKSTRLNSSH